MPSVQAKALFALALLVVALLTLGLAHTSSFSPRTITHHTNTAAEPLSTIPQSSSFSSVPSSFSAPAGGTGIGIGTGTGTAGLKAGKPGDVVMSKMGNETLKAELGRSAWRVLHTMAGKFPTEPNLDEQQAMQDFIYLFARLYPCGDCARHFKTVLEEHPPIVTSRTTITQWACDVHNVVNKRLHKPIFDCAKVLELWKCGCAEDALGTNSSLSTTSSSPTSHPTTISI